VVRDAGVYRTVVDRGRVGAADGRRGISRNVDWGNLAKYAKWRGVLRE